MRVFGHIVESSSNYRKPKRQHTLRGALSNATRAQILLLKGLGMPTSCAPECLHADSNSACKISRYLTRLPSLPELNQITCSGVKLAQIITFGRAHSCSKFFLCCRACTGLCPPRNFLTPPRLRTTAINSFEKFNCSISLIFYVCSKINIF